MEINYKQPKTGIDEQARADLVHTSSSSGSTVVSSYTLWFSIVFGTSFGGAYIKKK